MPAAAIAPIAGLAGSAISGIFGGGAASAQADAAKNAAAMQMQQAAQSGRVAALNREDQFPWMATGTNAINTLSHLMGIAGGTSTTPWSPSYAGTTPGAPSPFAVRPSGNGSTMANGQGIASGMGNMQGLRDVGDPASGTSGGFMTANGSPQVTQFQPGGAGGQYLPGGPLQPNSQAALGSPGNNGTPQSPIYDNNGQISGQYSGDGSLAQSWTQAFNAPDNLTEQNDPGFQARMKLGTDALQNSATARGNLLSGGTAKDLTKFGQDYGSNEYGNVYNRALGQYQQNYNIFQNNQSNLFNRLSALAGGGQVAAANIGGGALQAANMISGNVTNAGNDLQNAAYQRGSGYVNTGNAISGGLNNLGALAGVLKGGGSSNGGWPSNLSTYGM